MNRDEMIEEIRKKKECHLVDIVEDLVSRAMTQEENISQRYLEKEVVELKEKGISTMVYSYYFVTNRNFVRIFASENEYWYKLCPLNRFMGLEENNLPEERLIGDMDYFVKAGFPGELKVKIYFDVADEDLGQVQLESKGVNEKKEIKKLISVLMTAVSALDKE